MLKPRHVPSICAGALALALLVATGAGHRLLLAEIDVAMGSVTELARPLDDVPLQLGPWRGENLPLDPKTLGVISFDDEYINRRYVNEQTGRSLGLFVGYVGRPRTHFGHRPDVCYAAYGGEQIGQEEIAFRNGDARPISGVLYEFYAPGKLSTRLLVLGTYLINGRYSSDPEDFRRYNTRNPGLLGERKAYLTRVQIALTASGDRQADVALLCDLAAHVAGPVARSMPYVE